MSILRKCKVKNCENKQKYLQKGYCRKHYNQIYHYGKILGRTKFDPNKIIDCGKYYEICLYGFNKTGNKPKEIARTKIDKEDLEKVKGYKWCLNSYGYVITTLNRKVIWLHRIILGYLPIKYEVDHRDTDPLNNRKYNLRFVTRSQNNMNKKSKGYCWNKLRNKWQSQIKINKKCIHLGYFIDKKDAIKARKEAEQKYFGEFAYNN